MTTGDRRLRARKEPRQLRAERTRERILTSAAHIFTEHGYAGGTTNRIAEHARISIGSLYQYYPNKDAILAELISRHLDVGAAAVQRLLAGGLPTSLEDIMRGFVRAALENHLDDPQLLRVIAEEAPRSRELLNRVEGYERERVDFLRDLLERHPESRVADTRTAARLVTTTMELVVHKMIAAPDPVDVVSLENEMVAMLTRYLTAGGE
ncbi:TetR/AcrR family transcriptional regulator [Amycolatopsis jiangsuensis]|uniref:AcrR family transcriptional regulator n=1 Tax=Amycolatopsis jiangsuensis TaxID=1181879 RepID=A0A840J5H3_9PSEU|nr:TetR/AcrR family transcriptional regulator [Amycolatopsis jiangsuensis]MBB4688682.1 AcrR family transcriptional regulator [Amycolatopsis jiangsuensis]